MINLTRRGAMSAVVGMSGLALLSNLRGGGDRRRTDHGCHHLGTLVRHGDLLCTDD